MREYSVSAGGIWVEDTDGLVEVWDMSDQSGQVVTGIYGGNDGQLGSDPGADTNDPTWQADPPALDYIVDDYVDCGGAEDGSYCDLTDAYTIGIVLKWDIQANWDGVWSKGLLSTATTQYVLRINTTKKYNWLWNDGTDRTVTSNAAAPVGSYHSVFVTFKSGEQIMYIDGVAQTDQNNQAAPTVSRDTAKFLIGRHYTAVAALYFDGEIGPTMMYGASKSAAEVKAIHNNIRETFSGYSLPEAT